MVLSQLWSEYPLKIQDFIETKVPSGDEDEPTHFPIFAQPMFVEVLLEFDILATKGEEILLLEIPDLLNPHIFRLFQNDC